MYHLSLTLPNETTTEKTYSLCLQRALYSLFHSLWNNCMMLIVAMTGMVIKKKILIFTPLSSATGRLPPGAALPVHWLARLQGHTSLQTLHPPVGQEAG